MWKNETWIKRTLHNLDWKKEIEREKGPPLSSWLLALKEGLPKSGILQTGF